jgi:hypothetical protein
VADRTVPVPAECDDPSAAALVRDGTLFVIACNGSDGLGLIEASAEPPRR